MAIKGDNMNTNVEVLKERTNGLLSDAKGMVEQMNEISEWDSITDMITNVGTLSSFVQRVITAVELTANDAIDDLEDLKSQDKLDAAASVIDDAIDLPWWLEKIDGPIINMVISLCVNFINTKYGNEWDLDAARDAVKNGSEMITSVVDTI